MATDTLIYSKCPKCGGFMGMSEPPGYYYCLHTQKCGHSERAPDAKQLALPDAPHNGTETSRIAASMVNVSHQEAVVLDTLERNAFAAGLTQDELSSFTGLLRSAVAGRCNRLEHLGYIKKDGVRNSRYGRPCAIYVLCASHNVLTAEAHTSAVTPDNSAGTSLPEPASAGRVPVAPVATARADRGT